MVMDHIDVEDLYALKGTAVHVTGAFDQFRAADIPAGEQKRGVVDGIDPLTFYVGRVVRSFTGRPEDSYQRSVTGLIDRESKTVASTTGELKLDYGDGVVTLAAPKAQGAAGFLGRVGEIRLPDVRIQMRNDYGAVTVVPLDNRPLAESKRILIQALTIEQFHGFDATGKGNLSGRIRSVGSAPIGVEKIDARIRLKLDSAQRVRAVACDEHGYPTKRQVDVSQKEAVVTVTLDPMSPYHVLTR